MFVKHYIVGQALRTSMFFQHFKPVLRTEFDPLLRTSLMCSKYIQRTSKKHILRTSVDFFCVLGT